MAEKMSGAPLPKAKKVTPYVEVKANMQQGNPNFQYLFNQEI